MTDAATTSAPDAADPNEAAPGATAAADTRPGPFASFEDFYPYYLTEHAHPVSRRLHVVGTGLAILCLTQVAMWGVVGGFGWLVIALLVGYGAAWAGHFFFEKNRPATFTHPLWSLMGDFRMFQETVTGKRAF